MTNQQLICGFSAPDCFHTGVTPLFFSHDCHLTVATHFTFDSWNFGKKFYIFEISMNQRSSLFPRGIIFGCFKLALRTLKKNFLMISNTKLQMSGRSPSVLTRRGWPLFLSSAFQAAVETHPLLLSCLNSSPANAVRREASKVPEPPQT